MYQFWQQIFEPLLRIAQVRSILEIGSDKGLNTFQLVKYCAEVDGALYVIDPDLKYDWKALQNEHPHRLNFFHDLSLNVLKDFRFSLDAAFIDGDHNWHSVVNELRLIESSAKRHQHVFPLTFLHDVQWPYARRDLYYNPDTIPAQHRKAYAKAGVLREHSGLAEKGGLNSHLHHAINENEPHSGVLTAVEDFLAESQGRVRFKTIPILFGLGIVYSPEAPYVPALEAFLEKLAFTPEQLPLVDLVETERLIELTRGSELVHKYNAERKNTSALGKSLEELKAVSGSFEKQSREFAEEVQALKSALESEHSKAESLKSLARSYQREVSELKNSFPVRFFEGLLGMASLPVTLVQSLWQLRKADPQNFLSLKTLKVLRELCVIKYSGLFSEEWYLERYPDASHSGLMPILHYLILGASLGYNPNPVFDTSWYLDAYPDVAVAKINPLVHFIRRGEREDRFPDPFFDLQAYTQAHPELGGSPIAGLRHFLQSKNNHASAPRNSYESARIMPSVWAYSCSEKELLERVQRYNQQKNGRKAKVVVYTAIIGEYDAVILPETIVNDWDYVIFTDTPIPGEHIFEVREPPSLGLAPRPLARYLKTHPEEYFSNYDYCVWLDASILVRGTHLRDSVEHCIKSNVPLMGNPHPHRSCVKEELEACLRLKKDDAELMTQQISRYDREGLPEKFGMLETGILIRRLGDERVRRFNDLWWNEIRQGSCRDQLSVTYVLWKTGLPFEYLSNMKDIRLHGGNDYCLYPHRERANFHVPMYAPPVFLLSGTAAAEITPPPPATSTTSFLEDTSVDIIVCVHNALSDVKECLRSVLLHLQPGHHVIVVDDGSDEPTRLFLQATTVEHPKTVSLIRNEEARGYTRSANIGLRAGRSSFRILLNSDTIVTPRWAEKLCRVADENPRIGIVGPLSNAASWQSMPVVSEPFTGKLAVNELPTGYSPQEINAWCEANLRAYSPAQIPLINGFCYGISERVLSRVGFLDEEAFPRGYGEEDDLSLRAGAAGFTLAVAVDTYIYHAKSKSFGSAKRSELVKHGSNSLTTKHGERRLSRALRAAQQNRALWLARREFARKFGNGVFTAPPLAETPRLASNDSTG